MTDLLRVLPHFPVGQFARLIPALEKNAISTSDLLTLEAADIGRRTQLPLLDIRRLCTAVLTALHAELGVAAPSANADARQRQQQQQQQQHHSPRSKSGSESESGPGAEAGPAPDATADGGRPAPGHADPLHTAGTGTLRNSAASLASQWQTISTLDPGLDRALGGGIPAGYVTEITGESGAGKTQFLLTLLLSVQLPPPHGLGRPALYISTEAPLSTRRLAQILSANPAFQRLPPLERPSLDSIISTATPDLESQDHILTFQVPVEVERRGIGLVVLDSVAANYRAEFERSAKHGSNMGARTAELVKLGMHLRDLAQRHNLAVVVSNQVADRFSNAPLFPTPGSSFHHHHHPPSHPPRQTQESPLATRSRPPPTLPPSSSSLPSSLPPSSTTPSRPPPPPPDDHSTPSVPAHPALLLDHQQRWFTGWGDDPSSSSSLKTPSLGLVWTTQLAGRIALLKSPHAEYHRGSGRAGWRRWMKVVFAPHVGGSGPRVAEDGDGGDGGGGSGMVEFEVWVGGLRAVGGRREGREGEEE